MSRQHRYTSHEVTAARVGRPSGRTLKNELAGPNPNICYLGYVKMGNVSYLPILVLLLGAVGFAVAPLALAWLWAKKFSPAKPGRSKNAVYECGLEASDDAWVQFKPGYYLYAILFLVFDVEIVFLLPFATALTGFGIGECLALLSFLFLLIAGLAWAYQKKVLTWT